VESFLAFLRGLIFGSSFSAGLSQNPTENELLKLDLSRIPVGIGYSSPQYRTSTVDYSSPAGAGDKRSLQYSTSTRYLLYIWVQKSGTVHHTSSLTKLSATFSATLLVFTLFVVCFARNGCNSTTISLNSPLGSS
jgi:hypothetical protein